MKTAVVIGSSGLVGSHLVDQLLLSSSYSKIILINRKHAQGNNTKIEEHLINFDQPDLSSIKGDDVFCAIGTTLRKAGSKEAQFKIDCQYPSQLAALLKENGAKQFILVSSLGANATSSNFYLRTKGQLEKNIEAFNYHSTIFVRPSFILGDRKEFRFGEKIGIAVFKLISPLLLGTLKRYKGVTASNIAFTMITKANQNLKGIHIIESESILNSQKR